MVLLKTLLIYFLVIVYNGCFGVEMKTFGLVGNPLAHFHPCKDNENITASYEGGRAPGEENQYDLFISAFLPKHSRVHLKFDSEASIILGHPDQARIISTNDGDFLVTFFKDSSYLNMHVKGPATGTVPYLLSVNINTAEHCEVPEPGILDKHIQGYQGTAETRHQTLETSCGRRKVTHTALIVNGQPSKPGDWPWHTALYRLHGPSISYICGGTLISKSVVVTAAHCTTVRGVPYVTEALSVIIGKYTLIGGDISTQERDIHEIIVHEDFNFRNLNNDISLLKLKTEAVFDDYVQPACLWNLDAYKKLPAGEVYGTVAGWGFNHTRQLSPKLQQLTMPEISDAQCIKTNPVFFSKLLTDRKFCAGFRNGSSACNGDSGGGFMVFVPDVSGDSSVNSTGTWHLKGIVSMSVARNDAPVCDPYQYVLFTDVGKYLGWIAKYII